MENVNTVLTVEKAIEKLSPEEKQLPLWTAMRRRLYSLQDQ
jgi:hypothetical protein